ncbi:hypothetical protein MiSe_67200 [Microseira wollei NIES-4236]|uniref:Uncharacterized protein n=1 Tax=Microseira wollei NIES-4236 TaxID=2530354 RepID=A0AAV3XM85_9CYAN|nr:hypothetical protein MiSe_67200 [Microseira wollei NIES-4236]
MESLLVGFWMLNSLYNTVTESHTESVCIGIIEIFNGINDPGRGTALIGFALNEKVFSCRAPTTNFNHSDATGDDIIS